MEWYAAEPPEEAERVLAAWRDAPTDNVELNGLLLGTARLQVLTYGASSEDLAETLTQVLTEAGYPPETIQEVLDHLDVENPPIPDNWVYAQLQQAKNLYNAGRAAGDGDVGPDGFVFTPRPLDKTIRGIIKPPSGELDVL